MKELVSVVIPTLNSEEFLVRTIKSIKEQTYRQVEIIIVDAGSVDQTYKIATDNKCLIINSPIKGRSFQKNLGAKNANGEFVYFIDDDFEVDSEVVAEAVTLIKEKTCDVVEVHNTSDPAVSFWSKVRKFERDMYVNEEEAISPRFIPVTIFRDVNGFNEQLIAGEDYDFYNRLKAAGYKLGHTKHEEIHLGEPRNLKQIWQKHFFYGRSLHSAKGQNVSRMKLSIWQLIPLKPAYFKNFFRFIFHPLLTVGFIIYQLIRYSAGGLGFVYGFFNPLSEDNNI